MTESSTRNVSNEAPANNSFPASDEEALGELRALLFAHEQQKSSHNHHSSDENEDGLTELRSLLFGSELHERLENAKLRAEDVSQVLPEAIILRSIEHDEQLTKAMVPTVEGAIQASVKEDLNVLADALFPVIGPATRKAVSTALKTLTQSLNQTLDNSLSLQSFKWRLEARQTGKSFAEVVLLRTLIYRVEQVLLIHKKTGLLLQHLVAETVIPEDGDLVAAMLTAIQNFVQDSFSVQNSDGLETLHFGELTIWIEQGPEALLAGVIRGKPPQELRLVFQKTIEKIHREFYSALDSFQGDTAPFEATRDYLEDCCQAQYQPPKEKPSPLLWVLLGSIVFAMGFWTFVSIQEKQRWDAYLEKLNAQPGIVVTTALERHGKYFVSGLRDPLAVEPITLMKQANVNPEKVISRWEPYLSFYSGFIAQRAKQVLQTPPTVSLKVDQNGILYATGYAPRQWINDAQKLARGIPGITQFRAENLIETELQELQSSKEQIEKQVLRFAEGSTQLESSQYNSLQTLSIEIKNILTLGLLYNQNVHIEIIGHTNKDGPEEANKIISQARANAILSTLVSKGIKKTNLSAVGVGSTKPLQDEFAVDDKKINRSVTFNVFLTDASKRTATDR